MARCFGWTPNDMPMGPNDFYTIFRLAGPRRCRRIHAASRAACAACSSALDDLHCSRQCRCLRRQGTATWRQDSCPGFDVMDAGRMAVIQDPTGAFFCPWQAKETPESESPRVHGSLCWADLSTPDAKRAADFYSGLLGWQIAPTAERSVRLSAHQERRALHRRHSARQLSSRRSASALAGLLPGR